MVGLSGVRLRFFQYCMKFPQVFAILVVTIPWGAVCSQVEPGGTYFDPLSPEQVAEVDLPETDVPAWDWGSAIRETEDEIREVEQELAQLPLPQPNGQIQAYGYHSDFQPIMDEVPDEPRWQIELERRYVLPNLSIALIPAVDHRVGEKKTGYGFPRRFTIEAVEDDGSVIILVDWRHEDFPDPGRLPVIFDLPKTKAPWFRLNVYRGSVEEAVEYFALAEIVMIIKGELATTQQVNAGSSYSSPPYWDASYLNDWRMGLGLPVFGGLEDGADFLVQSEALRASEVHLRIDLGEVKHIPWTSLFPARSPGGVSVPGYGFPRSVKIEVGEEIRDGKLHNPHLYYESVDSIDPGNDWIRIRGSMERVTENARWVEFTFSDFPSYNGMPTFALGEISIDHRDVNHVFERPIKLLQGPEECEGQLSLLVDNKVSGRDISDRVLWLRGLAARKPLESKLAMLRESLEYQQQRRSRLISQASVFAAFALFVVAVAGLVLVYRGRKRASLALRKQITRDLHDDLGSKMATISLTSEFIRSQTSNPDIVEGSESILVTAGEMTTSLRDVLWFTDTETDQLAELVHRLGRVAEQMVDRDVLSLSMHGMQSLPRKDIELTKKREMIYFLREVLNNAVKYSEAGSIQVEIRWTGRRLNLLVQDDGKGFSLGDPSESDLREKRHYGLKAMEQRGKMLGAIYNIESELGKGTRVELDVPL